MAARGYRICRAFLLILSLAGISASFYSYYVEISKERDPSFEAACDINEWISCSKVFSSKYGRGFGLLGRIFGDKHIVNQPNSVFGMAFYTMMVFMTFQQTIDSAMAQIVFAILANLMSIYLAYILYFVLEDFCVVCVTTYAVNFLILVASYIKKSYVEQIVLKKHKEIRSKEQ